jgi:hypothetical protein
MPYDAFLLEPASRHTLDDAVKPYCFARIPIRICEFPNKNTVSNFDVVSHEAARSYEMSPGLPAMHRIVRADATRQWP